MTGEWVRSSACCSGECLEVRVLLDGHVWIRNNARPNTVVAVTAAEWQAFLAGVRAGDFTPEETP